MPLLEIDRLHARYEYARIVQGKASRLALMAAKSSACPGATAPTRRQRCEPSWAGFAPPEGRIVFNGEDIGGLSPDRIFRKGVAFIPEDRRVFATLTVEENLTLGVFTRWQMRAEQGRQLDRVFDLFPRLRERRSQLGTILSGGEQQILAIGRALVGSPELLLVDEPSEGLAPMVVTEIFESLARMRDAGIALLLVEQNVRRASAISSSCYVIEKGRIIKHGVPADVLADDAIRQRLSV